MILVFDLDDTLYEELSFVRGGFSSAARYLERKFSIPYDVTYARMLELLEGGRGAIFDKILKEHQCFSVKEVKKCISAYRYHSPDLCFYPDAITFLNKFKSEKKYIVTDGNKNVQQNKLKALSASMIFKKCLVTHCYGLKHSKPSPYCFQVICNIEKVQPSEVIYIGDNPAKDFIGIRPFGFRTVRLLRGNHCAKQYPPEYNAEFEIEDYRQLDQLLNRTLAK
jgi:putative hydrolase of the HAD superfamily